MKTTPTEAANAYTPKPNNQWAAKIRFMDHRRGPDAPIHSIQAEFVPDSASNQTVFFYIDNGYALYTEESLNRLIQGLGLIADQAHCGRGYATFRHPTRLTKFPDL